MDSLPELYAIGFNRVTALALPHWEFIALLDSLQRKTARKNLFLLNTIAGINNPEHLKALIEITAKQLAMNSEPEPEQTEDDRPWTLKVRDFFLSGGNA